MNKKNLLELFNKRGWILVRDYTEKPFAFHTIGLRFRFKNTKKGLSIVAGDGLYSTPRGVAYDYSAVEIGLIHFNDNDDDGCLCYLSNHHKYFSDVEGYVNKNNLLLIIKYVEKLKEVSNLVIKK